MRIVIHVEYDGANYGGWQIQDNARTIQGEIERAILGVTGLCARVHGAGRTDAGVHALCQVAHFDVDCGVPPDRFACALNRALPVDISIKKSFEADGSFHARYDAVKKHYRYVISNARQRPAMERDRCMWVPGPLDAEKMKRAAEFLAGTHDFASFRSARSSVQDTVRTVERLDVFRAGDIITIDVVGDGFLYNMVRILAGTLVWAGQGGIRPEYARDILEAKDRRRAGATAKAGGLFLVNVLYT